MTLANVELSGALGGRFIATFTAQEHHDIEPRNYGPARCRGCDAASWPHSPLPTASATALHRTQGA